MTPLRVVLDTNVVVAGLRSRDGASFRLLQLIAEGGLRPCISVALALEYEDVLKRDFMAPALTADEANVFLDYLFGASDLVNSVIRIRPGLRDPNDDRILEVAVRCGVPIVTFNEKDFAAAPLYQVKVISPRDFWKQVQEPT